MPRVGGYPNIAGATRRTALHAAAGLILGSAVPAVAATGYSPEFLECVRIWNAWTAEPDSREYDEAADLLCEKFYDARQRLIDVPVTTWQQVGELALIWRISYWHGDQCSGHDAEPLLEWAILQAIEKLSCVGPNDALRSIV